MVSSTSACCVAVAAAAAAIDSSSSASSSAQQVVDVPELDAKWCARVDVERQIGCALVVHREMPLALVDPLLSELHGFIVDRQVHALRSSSCGCFDLNKMCRGFVEQLFAKCDSQQW